MAQQTPHKGFVLLANALIILPFISALVILVPSQIFENATTTYLYSFLATISGHMCASAGAVWLCRQLSFIDHRKYGFLLKCFYFTSITLSLSALAGSDSENSSEQGWFGLGTARWIGLIFGGLVVDKVEGAREEKAGVCSVGTEEKHDVED